MRSIAPMRTAKIGYILISCLLCGFGSVLIGDPEVSAALLGKICGSMLILFGMVKMIGYFSKDLYRLVFQYDLALGILLIALGLALLIHPGDLTKLLCLILGLYVFADGLFKLQIAIESRQFGIRKWWLIFVLAMITGAAGLLLMFQPGENRCRIIPAVGATLLLEGILNFITVITAVKIVRHQRPDVACMKDCEERKD